MPTRTLWAVCMLMALTPLLLPESRAGVRAADVPPVVGAWIVTVTPTPGPTAPPPSTELTTFTRDGGVLNSNAPGTAAFPALSTGHGVWVREDDRTFAVTFVQWRRVRRDHIIQKILSAIKVTLKKLVNLESKSV
jgi:hypothetical protein